MALRLARVLSLALLCAPGCKRDKTESAGLGGDLFAPGFSFSCSEDADVGCGGVFEPRAGGTEAGPISGEDALGVRLASLKAAKRSIRVQALIFRADEAGLAISELLKQRKADGLDVRVIVDAMSNLDWRTQWMYFDLKRSGVEVEGYEALYMEWLTAEKLLKPWRANKRFHDKLWVIDGEDPDNRLAIVGGLNIANEYFRVANEAINLWQDQDLVLRGAAVEDAMAAFDRNYAFFKEVKGKLPRILNPDNAWKLSNKVMARINGVDVPTWQRDGLAAEVRACADRTHGALTKPIALRFLQSRPRHSETYIQQAYANLIENAKTSILIANAYFIPSKELIAALKRAVARGVEVVVLTNSPESNDIGSIAKISRYIYKDVMDPSGASVQIYEWLGPPAGEGTLHAKFALFDKTAAIIGSYNLDPRSERLNSETAIALRDPSLASRLEADYRDKLLAKSRQVSYTDATAYRAPEGIEAKFKLLFALPMKDYL